MRRRSLVSSFIHAGHGMARVFRDERNIRIHLLCAFFALLFGFILYFSVIEISIVLIVSAVVIAGELINAALERYSDIVKPRVSGYVEHIKDIAAAAVLVLSCMACIIALLLYVPRIILLLQPFFTG